MFKSDFGKFSIYGLPINIRYICLELAIRIVLMTLSIIHMHKIPFQREILSNEFMFHMYPYKEVSFCPGVVLAPLSIGMIFGVTCLVYVTFIAWKKIPTKLIVQDVINTILGATLAYLLTVYTTEIMKVAYGRPRPDYFNRCYTADAIKSIQFKVGEILPPCNNSAVLPQIISDGRKSFPSGHSSICGCVFLYIGLFIYRKLCQIKNSGSLRIVIPYSLFAVACVIMISRTSDYRHFASDVITGCSIGVFFTLICWFFYDNMTKVAYEKYIKENHIEDDYIHDPLLYSTPAQYAFVKDAFQDKRLLEEAS